MKQAKRYIAAVCLAVCLLAGCGAGRAAVAEATGPSGEVGEAAGAQPEKVSEEAGAVQADGACGHEAAVAGEGETVAAQAVGRAGMQAVYPGDLKEGCYLLRVDSSSSMFQIVDCMLTVQDGSMSARITMSGSGYSKLYMGTGAQAVLADDAACIFSEENEEGAVTFEIPVEALDMELDCAAFSKKKEKWYDRVLVFRADSLPPAAFSADLIRTAASLGLADGSYTVEAALGGGSGRAVIQSPAQLQVENGQALVTVVWGSKNYDYMKVDGERYEAFYVDGKSAFEIPVSAFDRPVPVIADTTAMGTPHEIEYTLTLDSETIREAGDSLALHSAPAGEGQEQDGGAAPSGEGRKQGGGAAPSGESQKQTSGAALSGEGQKQTGGPAAPGWMKLKQTGTLSLQYAEQFFVRFYEKGYAVITVGEDGVYLLVPENGETWTEIPEEVTVLQQPLGHIYLAATSAMDLFRALDELGAIRFSGTRAGDWYIREARTAMEAGSILYAGKYSAPDYEQLVSKGCDLAVESTMLYHTPEVREKLEALGIPVFVERSSYESHPLGRLEWLKLYGVLLGREEQAKRLFDSRLAALKPVLTADPTGRTAAFFYLSSNGGVSVRTSGDYVAKMIGLAGGSYVPETAVSDSSVVNMQMEEFFTAARDADYLIYSSAVGGSLASLDDLLAKSPLFSQFKAVKEEHVYCTGGNLFQETTGIGSVILELNRMFTEEDPELSYFYRLK